MPTECLLFFRLGPFWEKIKNLAENFEKNQQVCELIKALASDLVLFGKNLAEYLEKINNL
jgi:hypothetical protein